jgi:hypothetical protein
MKIFKLRYQFFFSSTQPHLDFLTSSATGREQVVDMIAVADQHGYERLSEGSLCGVHVGAEAL